MTKITEKISNTVKSHLGGTKEAVGETIGSPDLAASGATQKTEAETAQKVEDTKLKTEALGDTVKGKLEAVSGSLTGDESLKARGKADETMGEIKHNV